MKTTKKKIVLIFEKNNTAFSAYSINHSIFTTGNTIPELINNAFEAVGLFFKDENIMIKHDQIKCEIDFKQFFQYNKVLNARFLSDKIGINPTSLSRYIQGHKKPSENQTEKFFYEFTK